MRKDIYTLIGKRIREERLKRKLTIQDLALSVGTSPSFLTYIELGRKKASVLTFKRVAEGLSIPLQSLFSKTGSVDTSRKFSKVDFLLKGKTPKDRKLIMKVVEILSKELGSR